MLKFMYSQSTLAFDSFGDIIIESSDLKMKYDNRAVTLQALTDFLQTTYGDYFFSPLLGANYDQFIGKGITTALVLEIANKIRSDIILLEIIPQHLFEVYALKVEHTVQVRVILFEDDDYTINLTYDPSIGVTIGH